MDIHKSIADSLVEILFPITLPKIIELHKKVLDAAFYILLQEPGVKQDPKSTRDANLLYQMAILKCHSVLKLSEGFKNYTNQIDGRKFNPIYDSFSILSIVRPQFESFCNFNNIYMQSKNQDELNLKYNLWVLSGLKYRQSFNALSKENVQKKEDEKKQIEEIEKVIIENPCYIQFDDLSKDKVKIAIKRKEWKIQINRTSGKTVGWHELLKSSGIKGVYEQLYTHLSLGTHPSNVSIFQFGEAGGKPEQCFLPIQISCTFIMFLIRDFCTYFPNAANTFHKLPYEYRYIINTYNSAIRGEEYILTK